MNAELSMGVIRGVLTLLLMLAFIGMVMYVYSKRNKGIYEQAARLPLEDAPSVAINNKPHAVSNNESSLSLWERDRERGTNADVVQSFPPSPQPSPIKGEGADLSRSPQS